MPTYQRGFLTKVRSIAGNSYPGRGMAPSHFPGEAINMAVMGADFTAFQDSLSFLYPCLQFTAFVKLLISRFILQVAPSSLLF